MGEAESRKVSAEVTLAEYWIGMLSGDEVGGSSGVSPTSGRKSSSGTVGSPRPASISVIVVMSHSRKHLVLS